MSKTLTFEDILNKKEGFLRGPFGGDLKKEIFVPKSENTFLSSNEKETITK